MSYWKYLKQNRLWMIVAIVSIFALIFIAGFFMRVDSLREAKILAVILGLPLLVFFIGNYVKYKQDNL